MCNEETTQPPEQPRKHLERVKEWLTDNKIFFETVAVVLLSVMAILVSVFQCVTGSQQTKLAKLQTDLARQEWETEQQRSAIQKTAEWQRLRDAIWELFGHYPRMGTGELDRLDPKSKSLWFDKVRSILDSQTDNPVLIEDRLCLGCWRNAISNAKNSKELFETADMSFKPNFCSMTASSIMDDVLYVWKKLVLDSDEVSATGGRPPEAEQ